MRNVILLGLTSLFADFSSEMIFPILPFFITSLGGAGIAIGLISGVGDGLASFFKVFSGYYSDKTRKYKFFVYLGYFLSAVAKFFFPIAKVWQHLLIIRPGERIGKGLRDAPRDAIVSESLELKSRGRAFGIQRALDSTGAIIGSVVLLILFWYFDFPFRSIFLVAAFIALLALIPLIFVKEPSNLKSKSSKISFKSLSDNLKKLIFVATIFHLASFSYMFFILRASHTFSSLGSKIAIALPILLYVFFNIFDASFSIFAGSLSDRIGRKKVLIIGYLLFALTSLGFIFASTFVTLLILFALYGLFKAFIDASQRAFVSDLSEVNIRGTALGTFEASTGLALVPGGLIAGVLWNINPNITFAYGTIVALISVIMLLTLVKIKK